MRTRRQIEITDEEVLRERVGDLAAASMEFTFTPLPCDIYEFTCKPDMAHVLDAILCPDEDEMCDDIAVDLDRANQLTDAALADEIHLVVFNGDGGWMYQIYRDSDPLDTVLEEHGPYHDKQEALVNGQEALNRHREA